MATAPYLRYDVFTDRPYTGNPLAVLIDPPALTDEQHHRIANEFNLSETVFVRRDGDGWDTRIFTPTSELPFAGHPTIGAALALRDAGLVDTGLIDTEVTLQEGVGAVRVVIEGDLATLTTARSPQSVSVADPEEVARSVGLELSDLHPGFGPSGWTAGVPYTIVPVRHLDVLARARVDTAMWAATVALSDAPDLYVVAPLDGDDGERWQARMFAPEMGIAEDPATGSAAAAFVGFLAGRVRPSRLQAGWTLHQGVEMGRPSELQIGAVVQGNELVAATVGGRAVPVGSGELRLPT